MSCSKFYRSTHFLTGVFLALASGYLVFTLTPFGTATSPDSLSYLYAARSIVHGNGISVPDFDLASVSMEKPMTWWPPLYSVALSPFTLFNSPEYGARFFNWLWITILALTFAALAARMVGPWLGAAAGLWLLIQGPVLTIYAYAWSETLFLPLALIAYFFGNRYWQRQETWPLVVSALFLTATCYTRYIGLAFLPPLMIMVWHRGRNRRTGLLTALATGGAVVLALMPVFLRNLSQAGAISGMQRTETGSSLGENLDLLGNVLSLHLFNIPDWFLAALIITAMLLYFFFLHRHAADLRKQPIADDSKAILPDIGWSFLWAGCYLGALAALRTWKEFDAIDTRLISPAIPFIALGALGTAVWLWRATGQYWTILPLVLWFGLLAMHGFKIYTSARDSWQSKHSSMWTATALTSNLRYAYENFTANPDYQSISEFYRKLKLRYTDPVIIYDDRRPMLFGYLTHARVKTLPPVLDRAAVERINSFGEGVLLITWSKGMEVLTKYYGKSMSNLHVLPEFREYGVVISLPLPVKP